MSLYQRDVNNVMYVLYIRHTYCHKCMTMNTQLHAASTSSVCHVSDGSYYNPPPNTVKCV